MVGLVIIFEIPRKFSCEVRKTTTFFWKKVQDRSATAAYHIVLKFKLKNHPHHHNKIVSKSIYLQ